MAAKPNLDDPKLTVEIAVAKKQKAYRIAQSKGWSLTQLIEWFIDNADERGNAPSISDQIAQLQQKTAQLDQDLHDLKKKKAK